VEVRFVGVNEFLLVFRLVLRAAQNIQKFTVLLALRD